MGDDQRCDAQFALQALQFNLHAVSELAVERAKGLIEKQHVGLDHDRPRKRHPLTLTARELGRKTRLEPRQLHARKRLAHRSPDCRPRLATHPQAIADVFGNRHVRKQRVVLKHQAYVSAMGGQRIDRAAVKPHLAAVAPHKTRERAQGGGLAAA